MEVIKKETKANYKTYTQSRAVCNHVIGMCKGFVFHRETEDGIIHMQMADSVKGYVERRLKITLEEVK